MTMLQPIELYLHKKISEGLVESQILASFAAEYAPFYERYLSHVKQVALALPMHAFANASSRFSDMLLRMGFQPEIVGRLRRMHVKFSHSFGVSTTTDDGVDVALFQAVRQGLEVADNPNAVLSRLAGVIGHELGHKIDDSAELHTGGNHERFAEYFGRAFTRYSHLNDAVNHEYWNRQVAIYDSIERDKVRDIEYKIVYGTQLPQDIKIVVYSRWMLLYAQSANPKFYAAPLSHTEVQQITRRKLQRI